MTFAIFVALNQGRTELNILHPDLATSPQEAQKP